MKRRIQVLLLSAGLLGLGLASGRADGPEIITLWPDGVPPQVMNHAVLHAPADRVSPVENPTLTYYPAPAGKSCGTAVIVCPGGGYGWLATEKEGAAPARWLNSLGVSAFVLQYRLGDWGQPAPLRDVLRAMRLVRSQAVRYAVKPGRIGVMGFSAGGHVAACAGTLYNAPAGRTGAALDSVDARPDFLILCYPVITMRKPYVHLGSRENLLGKHPDRKLVDEYSTELHVNRRTPPTFLVAATPDRTVPVENSLMFYEALLHAGVPAELHLYEKGFHGFGLGTGLGPVSGWPRLCEQWLRVNGWLTRS